jgi:type IV secretory pathway VirD2 relaxase
MKTSRASEQEKFLKHSPGEIEENRVVGLRANILTQDVPDTQQQGYLRDCDVRQTSFPTEPRTVLTGQSFRLGLFKYFYKLNYTRK